MTTLRIDASHDAITCPGCRQAVPENQTCRCPMRTFGPLVEHPFTRLIKEGSDGRGDTTGAGR